MKHTHTEGPGPVLKSRFVRGMFPLMAALLACALAAPEARAAAPADFAKTFTVTVPTGLVDENETLTSFPLLLRLGTGIAGFNYADFRQNGADILVQDASGNALPYELENWDTAGESRLWVRVPSVAAGTTLSVYYGTKETVSPPAGMWSGYAGVWHFNEAGDGATTIADSSANALNGTSHASSKARSDGKLGGARGLELDAKNGAMTTVPDSAVLDALVPTFTVSGWVRPKTLSLNWGYLFARKTSDADPCWGLQFRAKDNANSIGIYSNGSADNDSNRALFSTSGRFTANTWTKYHVVYDNTTIRLYLDGALVDSKSAVPGAAVNKSNGFGIGGFPTSTNHSSLKADQDEVRLMNGAASAAWVAAEYRQESGSVVLSYGEVRHTAAPAPTIEAPVLSRNPATGAFTVSAELSENVPASVVCDADGVTNAMTTADVALPMTYSAAISGLSANTTYACLVSATSTGGTVTESVCPTAFYNGDLSVAKISDADENGLVPGVFRISRADTAHDLTVTYVVDGTATPGQTFETLSGTATIPAGSNSVDVVVVPLLDAEATEDTTVVLTLNAGLYGIDAQAGSAELTVVNLVAPAGYNTWIATSGGLASVSNNWSAGHPPTASENVLFDGRFSTANCEWDAAASATVTSWTQTNGYTGTVTLKTVYPGKGDFQCLTVTGPMAVMSGVITHPQSRTQGQSATDYLRDLLDNETYRVRIDAGSIVIGPDGRIDALNKGYYHSNTGSHTSPEPSHGGRLSNSGQAPYDDVKEPIHIGMPYKRDSGTYTVGIGGGAIYLTSTGAIVVNGYIGADTGSDTWNRGYTLRGGAAAGSVYVRGASVTGTGTISASALKTGDQNKRGAGGRVAVIATSSTPIDYTTLQLKATVYPFNNNNGQSSTYGGCGTVYVKDGTMANGVLIVRNFDLTFAEDASGRRTDVTAEGDWTFDRLELGGGVQLSVPCGTTLTLPGWDCVTAPANSTGTGTPSGFIYRGGTLDFGSAASVSLAGHWYFAPISNYVFNADVSLADGAAIGFGGKYTQKLANNAYPVSVDRIHCTVEGDLTVPSGCSVNVNKAGAMQDSNGTPSGYPQEAHGGRRSNTMATIGSVFHPRTLPHGQSNSYGHIIPGGAVELSVSGTFTLGGTVTSTGYEGGDGIVSQSAGGSIDISAGRLVGTGTITAGAIKNGQPGGRIAIRLTAAGATLGDFDGTVNCATMGAGSVGSCGSIYLETAADGDRRGTIILDDNNVTCKTYTPICATGYEADDVADFKKASLVIKQQAKGQVTAADAEGKFAMNSVEIDSTGQLDLFGHTLTVKSAKINGVKLAPGTYAAGSTVAIGEGSLGDYLVDTAEGADGKLVVKGVSFMVIVR